MNCPLCDRVKATQTGSYHYLVHEFENSYLMLGEHQYYRGYCVLVAKEHYSEMADIPSPFREKIFQEMMISSKVIQKYFKPKKMNLCSLGNVVEHLHWHFFPRYADDPQFTNPPWLQMQQFDSAKVTPGEASIIIQSLKKEFANYNSLSFLS